MKTRQAGFSLVELMVVVAIMAVVSLVAIPILVTTMPKYKLKKQATDLCSELRKARSTAIKQNQTFIITIAPDDRTYRVDGADPVALENGIAFGYGSATSPAETAGSLPSNGVSFADNTITFTPQALSNAGCIYLQNNNSEAYAILVTAAGNIALRQWRGAWN